MPKFLNPFSKKKIKKESLNIIIDNRERNSLIPTHLKAMGFQIQFKQLPVADYLVNNIAVERKTLSDFKSSIVNKRIIKQLLEIKQYPNHILILEGLESEDPYFGNLHENAFRGFLLSVALEYKVPILFSLNDKDTAKYLYVLAKKQTRQDLPLRASKIFLSKKEQLQFILEGFPGIGPSTAKKLLKHFMTIKQLTQASESDLEAIIGKKSELLYKLINAKY